MKQEPLPVLLIVLLTDDLQRGERRLVGLREDGEPLAELGDTIRETLWHARK